MSCIHMVDFALDEEHVFLIISLERRLNEDVLNAFSVSVIRPDDKIPVEINDLQTLVMMSPTNSHFSEMNLIETEFMVLSGSFLTADFSKRCFSLKLNFYENQGVEEVES
ncbi:8090_t:CDS:2 [Funneliformis geosporum]|uniref:9804_t:CDS:1 n=1 Tax=Funneliformis geosporum TaxID=1117311 RepID=A0A9W4SSU1_9GLOM|nr:9804_t:CDS:2 [Funneliformis geosporum]CAI2181179.1 8090_t:CDS:2 [Funneliformis geosporum]